MPHTVIIGNGIAGITCARHLRKRCDDPITVISGESDYFFSRTSLMYIYMGHMKYEHTKPYEDWFWDKNRIQLKRGWVKRVDFDALKLEFDDGEILTYERLVIATGSKPRILDVAGVNCNGVQGLYSLQDLELLEANTHAPKADHGRVHQAVIVGGGLIAVELTEMLKTRGIDVQVLVRERRYWGSVLGEEEAKFVDHQFKIHGVEVHYETKLREVLSDDQGRVCGVVTDNGEEISCQFVGIAIGVEPNVEFLRDAKLQIDKGVIVDEFFETNIPEVYAIGDCAQLTKPPGDLKAINQVWYTGRMMGETLAISLAGDRTPFRVGPWFNSAKFFDLEYQTYGQVLPEPGHDLTNFIWQDKSRQLLIKVQINDVTGKVQGINSLGVRINHSVIHEWLSDEVTIQHLLRHLDSVIFDPEFTRPITKEIHDEWNRQHPEQIINRKKRFSLF